MTETDKKRALLTDFAWYIGIITLYYLFFKYAFIWIFPFLIGLIIALTLKKPIDFISDKFGIGRKIICGLFMIIFWCAVGFLAVKLGQVLYEQAKNLIILISDIDLKKVSADISSLLGSAVKTEDVESALSGIFEKGLTNLFGAATSFLTAAIDLVKILPEILLFFVAAIMSSYFFAADGEKIRRTLEKTVPKSRRLDYLETRDFFSGKLLHLLLAYIFIMVITFVELLAGFLVIGTDYAVLTAAIIAVLDILPVLGTGTVLIPWGTAAIINGDTKTGIGLLILWAVISVIRQFAEPRIVGSKLGLSPLVSLVMMYAGLKLFGVIGVFIAPLTMIYLKFLNDTDRIKLWSSPDE